MKTVKGWSVAAVIAGLLILWGTAVHAGYCGGESYRHCRARSRCCAICPAARCPCQPVEYEERQVTEYESKFKEVEQTKVIDVVKFVEDVEEREVTVTDWQEQQCTCGCRPCCGSCCKTLVPVQRVRKVKVPVIREVPAKETLKFTRIVEEKIPRTSTCKVAKPSCCVAEVPSCCPVPCCGGK